MRYFGQGLLMLLIALFIFSGCQKADNIGLDIDPQDSIQGKLIVDFNVNTITVRDDSLNTSTLEQYPIGSLNDPLLGGTDAGIALGVSLPSNGFSFGTNPALDSVVLVIRYGNDFYGDSTSSTFDVSIHKLSEKFGQSFASNKTWNYEQTQLGRKEGMRFNWRDSIKITQQVKGGPDTLVKVAPQLRIRMSETSFIGALQNAQANNYFANNTAFANNVLNGLYLKATKQNASVGGIGFLNLRAQDVASRMEVYYRTDNSSGGRDTLTAAFNISGAAPAIKHDYTGTPVEEQLEDPSKSYSTVYVQPMGGLKAKITFPDLKKLKELGTLAINKAELVVNVEDGTTNPLEPSQALTIYQTDIAGQRQVLPDQFSYWGGSIYDSDKKRYIFNVSTYVQRILSGQTEQYPIYIIPANLRFLSQQSQNISPIANTAERSVLSGKGTPGDSRRIKLNIYYNKLRN